MFINFGNNEDRSEDGRGLPKSTLIGAFPTSDHIVQIYLCQITLAPSAPSRTSGEKEKHPS
ncbi:hypothetical protein J6590_053694 [Homalodisca vitripennis]|nr:hypothetical protein J6590_053694 [Homalodisca vitripennis]